MESRSWTSTAIREGLLYEWHLVNGTKAAEGEKTKCRLYEKTSSTIRLEIKFENPARGKYLVDSLDEVEQLLDSLVTKGTELLNQIHHGSTIVTMGDLQERIVGELQKVFKRPLDKRSYEYFVKKISEEGIFDVSKAPERFHSQLDYALRKIVDEGASWLERRPKPKVDGSSSRKFFYALVPEKLIA